MNGQVDLHMPLLDYDSMVVCSVHLVKSNE